jgi:tRNA threonylcarbamoyladenosine biosynthesis protein TsaE
MTMSGVGPLRLTLVGEGATARLAAAIAESLAEDRSGAAVGEAPPAEIILLSGDLGAGKSSFARAFIRALTSPDEEVPSPTFTLLQTYEAVDGRAINHFDLYRLSGPDELVEVGFDEAIRHGISLVEWPERLGATMPPAWIAVTLSFRDREEERDATVSASAGMEDRLALLASTLGLANHEAGAPWAHNRRTTS